MDKPWRRSEENELQQQESHKKDCPKRKCVDDYNPSEFSEKSLEL